MGKTFTKDDIKRMLTERLSQRLSTSPEHAGGDSFYKAAALTAKEILLGRRRSFIADARARGRKQAYYLSMEFLLGRSLKNAIYNLGLTEEFSQALSELGMPLESIYGFEPDAGLGNGGLGRLAACYMDALATCEYPAMGYSILYEYGIFKQKLVDGWQAELPDDWLQNWDVWLTPKKEHSVTVRFGGELDEFWENGRHYVNHKNFTKITAVPYDVFIPGYDSKGVSVLRLWKAQGAGFDMESFNRGDYIGALGESSMAEVISKVLYPNDSHIEGKTLRLRQQYFLVSASISDIVRRHIELYGTIDNFPQKNAVHINDTHPALAIPELMRILLDDCGYSWGKSWDIVNRTFAYTNHTVMKEALEVWDEGLIRTLLPRIHQIIHEINRRFCEDMRSKHRLEEHVIGGMSIVYGHSVRMANLCVVGAHSVNGVSKLHSGILRDSVFNDFYKVAPYKFTNVTNGIASRRWLLQANPDLTALVRELIGDGFLKDMTQLAELKKYADDTGVHERLHQVKLANKRRLAAYVKDRDGVTLDPNAIFDVQVKRLHEYKRQHLNALHIISLYNALKENPALDIPPRTYIFGAKAAPGYYIAKQIIKLICSIRDEIERDPVIREKLRIVYLEDYSVSISEILMPASEISEQISLAGTEASGTGNMKLMLGGAITLGTMDGANIEISEEAGLDNILIFGMDAREVNMLRSEGYNPQERYERNPVIKSAVDMMLSGVNGNTFPEVANSLRYSDPYMVLEDFESYRAAQKLSGEIYRDFHTWQRMSLYNIAGAGHFCADRAVTEYARNIWGL